MGKIQWGRVVLGGLVAGVVINIGEYVLNSVFLVRQWEEAMKVLDRPTMGGGAIVLYVLMCFVLGIAAVYLYAAVRPRFGAGPKTAMIAGFTVWFFSYCFSTVGFLGMDLVPASLLVIGMVWGLIEIPLATLLGAWLYREESA